MNPLCHQSALPSPDKDSQQLTALVQPFQLDDVGFGQLDPLPHLHSWGEGQGGVDGDAAAVHGEGVVLVVHDGPVVVQRLQRVDRGDVVLLKVGPVF